MASRLGVELFEIVVGSGRLVRYLKSFWLTLKIIRQKRPKVVIAPNPSVVLSYLLLFLRKTYKFSLVTDAHFGGVQAYSGNLFFQRALDYYNSKADLVIVTTDSHADYVRSIGGRAFICQDPLPQVPMAKEIMDQSFDKSIFFICSFDVDEPFENVFKSFSSILQQQGFLLFVSGNYKKANIDVTKFPGINFLGYLPRDEYYGYLKQCSLVVDLTSAENCLVCGAYEALAAGKPIVVSETSALKAYFGSIAVFVDNSPYSIASGVVRAYKNREQLISEIKKWVIQNDEHMTINIDRLKSMVMSFL